MARKKIGGQSKIHEERQYPHVRELYLMEMNSEPYPLLALYFD